MFETIQGEGVFTGVPAVFVRLQECPVGCSWCDTKQTWYAEEKDQRQIGDIFWINCQLVSRCFFAWRVDVAALFACVFALFEPKNMSVNDSVEPTVHENSLADVALSVLLVPFAEL